MFVQIFKPGSWKCPGPRVALEEGPNTRSILRTRYLRTWAWWLSGPQSSFREPENEVPWQSGLLLDWSRSGTSDVENLARRSRRVNRGRRSGHSNGNSSVFRHHLRLSSSVCGVVAMFPLHQSPSPKAAYKAYISEDVTYSNELLFSVSKMVNSRWRKWLGAC